ncbi:MAG: formimidoylglutamase [Chloroflexi bacterium]|nr:formimidoylglutamase [Chloroflexota bacterium]
MNLFQETVRPVADLFYRRGDPNDSRLGETALSLPVDYGLSDVVLLGLPQDDGVRRNRGRPGAKEAPDAIRRALYRMIDVPGLRLFDLGNTRIHPTLEATHEAHREVVRKVLRDGKLLIVLGGGNDTSYPDCSGLAMETKEPILAFNIDAHFDVRADPVRNSGTPYRQLLVEEYIHPFSLFQIGYQPFSNSLVYRQWLMDVGVNVFSASETRRFGVENYLTAILARRVEGAIFWGLDMDVVRASEAPGVSAPNALGFTADEFCSVAAVAGRERRTRLFEITEVNPSHDLDDRTSRLAATAVWTFLWEYRNR